MIIAGPGGSPPWRVQGGALGIYLFAFIFSPLSVAFAFGALFTTSRCVFCIGLSA